MSFTLGLAIDRLTNSGSNAFPATFTDLQKRQRINETLEGFYLEGDWRGLFDRIAPVSVGSIITLPSAYLRLDGLSEENCGAIEIKSMQWEFQPGGPGAIHTPTEACLLVAIDMGDVGGFRKYRLTGSDATNDARELIGLARRRFVWLTDTAAVIEPDSYRALEIGVEAIHWRKEGDTTRYMGLWKEALAMLDSNLDEFESGNEMPVIAIDPFCGCGSIPNLV